MWYVRDNKQNYCVGTRNSCITISFLVVVKNTVHLWLLQQFFCVLMYKCEFWLMKQQQQWRISCKRVRQWWHILVSITSNPSKTTHVWTTFQSWKWEKWSHTCVTLIAYILCKWSMNFSDIWNKNEEDYYILFNKLQQTGIVRFLLLFEKHVVKILITSFWDTQYNWLVCPFLNAFLCWIQNRLITIQTMFWNVWKI